MPELNSIAASLAVVRYKNYLRSCADAEDERHTVNALDSNELHNRYGTPDLEPAADSDASDAGDAEESVGSADDARWPT